MRRIGLPVAAAFIAASAIAAGACDSRRPTASAVDLSARAGATATIGAAEDAVLAARLQSALKSDPITSDAEIQVSVAQRRVRLSGFVESAAVKLRAGALAAEIEGVEDVDNRLIQRHHAGVAAQPLGGARVHL